MVCEICCVDKDFHLTYSQKGGVIHCSDCRPSLKQPGCCDVCTSLAGTVRWARVIPWHYKPTTISVCPWCNVIDSHGHIVPPDLLAHRYHKALNDRAAVRVRANMLNQPSDYKTRYSPPTGAGSFGTNGWGGSSSLSHGTSPREDQSKVVASGDFYARRDGSTGHHNSNSRYDYRTMGYGYCQHPYLKREELRLNLEKAMSYVTAAAAYNVHTDGHGLGPADPFGAHRRQFEEQRSSCVAQQMLDMGWC
jgi:hypothetical protein